MIDEKDTLRLMRRIKAMCPRFSLPASSEALDELVGMWCRSLNFDLDMWPTLYFEALDSFFATAGKDDAPPMPGDVRKHLGLVLERVESDPVRGPKLREWRRKRVEERSDRLAWVET